MVVNGPRQAGKSTLLEQVQRERGPVVTLDEPTHLDVALHDPVQFLAQLPQHVALDEFQRGGDPLLLALKARIDASRARGQYLLAGSTRFLTTRRLSETLTGRIAIAELLPLSMGEIRKRPTDFLKKVFSASAVDVLLSTTCESLKRSDYAEAISLGGFPEVVLGHPSHRFRASWTQAYVATVTALAHVEQVTEVRRPELVGNLLRQMAARSAQEINVADLARELQVDEGTIRNYLDILATLYLVRVVPAWSTSLTTRAKKRAVGHVLDTAVACGILGQTTDSLTDLASPHMGPLLESFVVGEVCKQMGWTDFEVRLFHYRDRDQREIDLVLESTSGIVGIEVKASSSPTLKDARHLIALRDKIGTRFKAGLVLHTGTVAVGMGDRLAALPVSVLWS